jgi:tRNA pseudouridine13 synthase
VASFVSVPEIDHQMGIEVYMTKRMGVGGRIRRAVEDFVVEEVLVDGSKATASETASKPPLSSTIERQRFLLCVMVKRNWDTFIAVKNLAIALGINQDRIQIAGIKDAKAVTAQHITIENVSAEEVASVSIRDIMVRPVGYFHEALCPFYLFGNNFKINITGIPEPVDLIETQIASAQGEVETLGGIPNFYGHQRFGTTRAITHLVGKAMVQGNLEEAAMVFLAKPSIHEHPESMRARKELQDTRNFGQALRDFPRQLRFERMMLALLVENPNDFSGAFRRLPIRLRLLFVQAWQSYLFNRFLSARIRSGVLLGKAEAGDFVVNVERNGLPMAKMGKAVDSENVAEVNRLIEVGKMRVALPVFGAKQKLSSGSSGELQRLVLEEECVDAGGFWVPDMPELSARGELRAAVCPVSDFSAGEALPDSEGKVQLALEFRLLRSAYATVLLREIMKPTDLITAGF